VDVAIPSSRELFEAEELEGCTAAEDTPDTEDDGYTVVYRVCVTTFRVLKCVTLELVVGDTPFTAVPDTGGVGNAKLFVTADSVVCTDDPAVEKPFAAVEPRMELGDAEPGRLKPGRPDELPLAVLVVGIGAREAVNVEGTEGGVEATGFGDSLSSGA
jgi:hypothetical protein